jgi:hypothetical protein
MAAIFEIIVITGLSSFQPSCSTTFCGRRDGGEAQVVTALVCALSEYSNFLDVTHKRKTGQIQDNRDTSEAWRAKSCGFGEQMEQAMSKMVEQMDRTPYCTAWSSFENHLRHPKLDIFINALMHEASLCDG